MIGRSAFGARALAYVASVSNRVIARKLRAESFPSPSPVSHSFFCSCPSFLDEPREETLATQATRALFCTYILGSIGRIKHLRIGTTARLSCHWEL